MVNKAFTLISTEYSDFADNLILEVAFEFFKHTSIKNHAIKLNDKLQLPYGLFYSLELVKLETLKTYIKTNLAKDFIKSFEFPIGAPIFFNKKPNKNI